MTIRAEQIIHQGLRRLWLSFGLDNTGVSIMWANTLRSALSLLAAAHCLAEILEASREIIEVKKDTERPYGYYVELSQSWRLTFNVEDPESGDVTALDIEIAEHSGN